MSLFVSSSSAGALLISNKYARRGLTRLASTQSLFMRVPSARACLPNELMPCHIYKYKPHFSLALYLCTDIRPSRSFLFLLSLHSRYVAGDVIRLRCLFSVIDSRGMSYKLTLAVITSCPGERRFLVDGLPSTRLVAYKLSSDNCFD